MKLLYLLAVLISLVPQQSGATLVVESSFGNYRTDEEITDRFADLGDRSSLPEDIAGLFELGRQLDEEIPRVRREIASLRRTAKLVNLEDVKRRAQERLRFAAGIDCKTTDKEQLQSAANGIRSLAQDLSRFFSEDESPIDNPWLQAHGAASRGTCESFKSTFSDPAMQKQLSEFIDSLRQRVDARTKSDDSLRQKYDKYLQALLEKKSRVQSLLNERTTQQQIGASLWKVILVIGILCIVAIVVVKIFAEKIQLEWVASGQVIQFVTVMILLTVVMALGLSGILKENTLGTLLGGIAGYVLAQGVGRVREHAQGRESTSEALPSK